MVEEEEAFKVRGEAKGSRVSLAGGADGSRCGDRWGDLDSDLGEKLTSCMVAPDGLWA